MTGVTAWTIITQIDENGENRSGIVPNKQETKSAEFEAEIQLGHPVIPTNFVSAAPFPFAHSMLRHAAVCLSDYYGRYLESQLSNERHYNELNLLE